MAKNIDLQNLRKGLEDAQKAAMSFLDVYKELLSVNKQNAEITKKSSENLSKEKVEDIDKINKSLEKSNRLVEDKLKIDKKIKETTKELKKIKEEKFIIDKNVNDAQAKSIKQGEAEIRVTKEEQKAAEKINKAKSRQGQIAAENSLILSELNKRNKEQAKISLGLVNAYQKESATLNKLRKQWKNLAVQNKENTKEGRELLANITKLDAKLKNIDKSVGQNQRTVGGYSNALKEAGVQSGLFSNQLNTLSRIQGTLNALLRRNTASTEANGKAQKVAASSSGKFSKALRILKIALISTGIGAIVVAIGALSAGFLSTQRGADTLARALRPLQVMFEKVIGFIQDKGTNAFDGLADAIKNPTQAFKDLGEAILNNVIKRFEALSKFGPAIVKLLKGELVDGFEDLTDAAIQFGTGVEGATDKIKQTAEDIAEEIRIANEQAEKLQDLIEGFEKREINLVVPLAKARLEYEKLRSIAQDQLNADEDRIVALDKAIEQQKFIVKNENDLIRLRLKAAELEATFNDTNRETELEIENLKKELLLSETAGQKKINTIIAQRSAIEKRQIAEREKERKRIAAAEAKKLQDEIDAKNARIDAIQEEFDKKQELAEEQAEKEKQLANDAAEEITKINDRIFDRKQQQLQRELDDNLRVQDEITNAINNGSVLAEESLAEAKREQLEIQAEQAKQENRRLIIEGTIAGLNAYAQNGDVGETLAAITLISDGMKAVQGAFYEGTDSVGETNSETKVHNGRDGYLASLHEGEKVFNSKQSSELNALGFSKRDDILELARSSTKRGAITSNGTVISVDNTRLISEVKEMNTLLKNLPKQMPVHNTGLTDDPRYIQEVWKTENRLEKTRRRANGTFN